MQIFVTGTTVQTALDLDRKRLSNQITEARITFDCLMGKNGWDKHPLIKMYRGYEVWLDWYIVTLRAVFRGDLDSAIEFSREAEKVQPEWFNEEFYNMHRSRLYTKNPKEYFQWSYLGESYSNWYRVDGVWKEYKQK